MLEDIIFINVTGKMNHLYLASLLLHTQLPPNISEKRTLVSNIFSFLKYHFKMSRRPQTSGSARESELKAKAAREMKMTKDPIEKMRLFALSRGAQGILGLGR